MRIRLRLQNKIKLSRPRYFQVSVFPFITLSFSSLSFFLFFYPYIASGFKTQPVTHLSKICGSPHSPSPSEYWAGQHVLRYMALK